MDDPFDYDADGKVGAVEVSLAPLDYLEASLTATMRSMDEGGGPAPQS